MMKIVLIGANGTIGKAVAKTLEDHQLITVGFSEGEYQVDIEDRQALTTLFNKIGKVDAIISAAGAVAFAPSDELSYDQVKLSVNNKLVGNTNVFQIGQQYVNEGGSITLTSGVLAQQPMHGGSIVSSVNAALDAFAKATAFELGTKLRINTVSPHFVKETMAMMGMDTKGGISAADTAKAYLYAVTSDVTGQAIDVADHI